MHQSTRRITTAIALLTAVGLCLPVIAADWPHWTGPNGTNAVEASNLPARFDRKSGENVKWVTRLGEVVFGAPTVSDGRVFVGTNMAALREDPRFRGMQGGVLACLDEETGAVLWTLATPERAEGFPKRTHMTHQRWGICSSPTVDGDRAYVVTNGDDVLCLDIKGLRDGNDGDFHDEATFMAGEGREPVDMTGNDGDILWRFDIPRELDVAPHDVASSSVLVHDDALYVATSNGIGTGSPVYALKRDAPAFIVLDKHTGAFLAREDVALSRTLFHAQWGSATRARVGDSALIFLGGGDGICYAFDALSGNVDKLGALGRLETAWRFNGNPPHYLRDAKERPIYYYRGDLRVYKNKRKNEEDTTGFNNGDGNFVGPNEILASPVFYKGRVYVVTGRDPLHGLARGTLSCIDATKSGDVSEEGMAWQFEDIGRSLSTVAISEDLLFAADLAGSVYCLDADTGELHWKHETRHEIWGNPLVADGKVYVNTKQSFWTFEASQEKKVLFTSRGGSECGPIAANGVVYAYIRGQLYALAK
jgi:outer membrane protein assembly factor BamB